MFGFSFMSPPGPGFPSDPGADFYPDSDSRSPSPIMRIRVADEEIIVTDPAASVSQRAFYLGQAFGAACNTARKLGWMV
jgi:hypothetical protein